MIEIPERSAPDFRGLIQNIPPIHPPTPPTHPLHQPVRQRISLRRSQNAKPIAEARSAKSTRKDKNRGKPFFAAGVGFPRTCFLSGPRVMTWCYDSSTWCYDLALGPITHRIAVQVHSAGRLTVVKVRERAEMKDPRSDG